MTSENAYDRSSAKNYRRSIKFCKFDTSLSIYDCGVFFDVFFCVINIFKFACLVNIVKILLHLFNDISSFSCSFTSHYSTCYSTNNACYNKDFRAVLFKLKTNLTKSSCDFVHSFSFHKYSPFHYL